MNMMILKSLKKPLFWITLAVVSACFATLVFLLAIRAQSIPPQSIQLPSTSTLLSLEMEQIKADKSTRIVTVTDTTDMEALISALSRSRKTSRQSVNDSPNEDNYLIIRLKMAEGEKKLYLFSAGKHCYLEEPYVGIYRIDKETNASIYAFYEKNTH